MGYVIVRIKLFFLIFILASTVVLCGSAKALDSKTKAAEEAGALLFRDRGCTYCHGVGGIGTKKAPPLTDLPKEKTWPPAKITDQILNGGQKMPPFRDSLSDEEIAQLVAYLRSKHKPVPPPSATPIPPPGD